MEKCVVGEELCENLVEVIETSPLLYLFGAQTSQGRLNVSLRVIAGHGAILLV